MISLQKEAEKSPGAHKKYDVKRETEIDVYGDEDDETTAQPNAESIQAGGNIMGAFDTIKEAAEKVGHAVKRGFESVDKKVRNLLRFSTHLSLFHRFSVTISGP